MTGLHPPGVFIVQEKENCLSALAAPSLLYGLAGIKGLSARVIWRSRYGLAQARNNALPSLVIHFWSPHSIAGPSSHSIILRCVWRDFDIDLAEAFIVIRRVGIVGDDVGVAQISVSTYSMAM